MPYAQLNGLKLYYERAGLGDPPLLFVPGWCCDQRFYAPQVEHFQTAHDVAVLDPRGCGHSDRPEDGYDIASSPTTSPGSAPRSACPGRWSSATVSAG
jgi:pimeloyl-ACP methyl ester carboxylesterase